MSDEPTEAWVVLQRMGSMDWWVATAKDTEKASQNWIEDDLLTFPKVYEYRIREFVPADELAALRQRCEKAERELAEARAMLKRTEWPPFFVDNGGCGDHWTNRCPVCYSEASDGHDDGCKLAAVLARLEKEGEG